MTYPIAKKIQKNNNIKVTNFKIQQHLNKIQTNNTHIILQPLNYQNSIIIITFRAQMFKRLFDTKLFRWVKYIRQQLQNQRQNRQQIGEDRYGNKYYQYYSYWGLPTRRQIRWKLSGDFVMKDLVYYRWLHQQEFDAPTESEKQQFYLEENARFQRALEWDQKESNLLEQFRIKRQELALRDQALAELQKEMQANSELTNIKTKRTTNQTNTDTNVSNPENPKDNHQSS